MAQHEAHTNTICFSVNNSWLLNLFEELFLLKFIFRGPETPYSYALILSEDQTDVQKACSRTVSLLLEGCLPLSGCCQTKCYALLNDWASV